MSSARAHYPRALPFELVIKSSCIDRVTIIYTLKLELVHIRQHKPHDSNSGAVNVVKQNDPTTSHDLRPGHRYFRGAERGGRRWMSASNTSRARPLL